MAVEVEGLQFKFTADTNEAIKSLESLQTALQGLSGAVSRNAALRNLSERIRSISDAVRGVDVGKAQSLTNALQGLSAIQIPSSAIANRVRSIVESMNAINVDPQQVTLVSELANSLSRLGGMGSNGRIRIDASVNDRSISRSRVVGNAAIQNMGTAQNSDVQEIASRRVRDAANAIREARRETSRFAVASQAASRTSSSFSGALARGGGIIRSFGTALLSVSTSPIRIFIGGIRSIGSAVGGLVGRIRRIVTYRLIRQALQTITKGFQEGLENLYKYSQAVGTTFAGSMDRLATSALYMKNSLAAMAAPIIEAVAPAIDFVVDKIVELMNWINQLFAKLTGKDTYTVAVRQAAQWGDTTDKAGKNAASGIKAANDELKRSILSFDELHVLTRPNASGSAGSGSGSGGASGANYSTMFKEVPIDSKISDFVNRLKEAFEGGDWYGVGTIIGDKVNEIFDSLPTHDWGVKIGEAVNAAIGIAHGFLDTTEFGKIGGKLAEGVNGILTTVNFEELGQTLALSFTSLLDLVGGFLAKLDFGAAGKAVHDGVTGFFNELTSWVQSKNWETIGNEAYEKVKEFIENLHLEDIIESLSSFLGTSAKAIWDFGYGVGEQLGKDMKQGMKDALSPKTIHLIENLTDEEKLELARTDPIMAMFQDSKTGEAYRAIGRDMAAKICEGIAGIGDFIHDKIIDPFFSAFDTSWELHLVSIGLKIMNWIKGNPALSGIIKIMTGYDFGKMPELNVDASSRTASMKLSDGSEFNFDLIKDNKTHEWKIDLKAGDNTSEAMKALASDKDAFGALFATVGLGKDTVENLRQAILDGEFNASSKLKVYTKDEDGNRIAVGSPVHKLLSGERLDGSADVATRFAAGESSFGEKAIKGEKITADMLVTSGFNSSSKVLSAVDKGKMPSSSMSIKGYFGADTTGTIKEIGKGKIPTSSMSIKGYFGSETTGTIKKIGKGETPTGNLSITAALANTGAFIQKIWKGEAFSKIVSIIGSLGEGATAFFSALWNGGNISKQLTILGTLAPMQPKAFQDIWNNNALSVEAKVNLSRGADNTGLNLYLGNGYQKSLGGVFANGTWRDIPQFAAGGFPNHGTVFAAGESGPEVVGHIGGRTEVLNASQLAATMYSAVVSAMAVSGASGGYGGASQASVDEQNRILRRQTELLEELLAGGLKAEVTTRSFAAAESRMNRRTGAM